MDDAQLTSLHEQPSAAFASRVKAALDAQEVHQASTSRRWLRPVFAPAVAVVLVLALLSVPSVRASAESFLALFRVVNFVAVPIDEERLAVLQSQQFDPATLMGDRMQILETSSPVGVASPEQAGEAAGIVVHVPTYLPTSTVLAGIEVVGRQRARVTADNSRIRGVMDALGITDLSVPDALDGQIVDLTIPPVVTLNYDRGGSQVASLKQASAPQIALPAGVDLSALAEIGLRVLGLSSTDAREFAQAVDWHTTLAIPLPTSATSFKQVTVSGQPGLEVQRARTSQDGKVQQMTQVVWSSDGQVYGIVGVLSPADMLEMAESLK